MRVNLRRVQPRLLAQFAPRCLLDGRVVLNDARGQLQQFAPRRVAVLPHHHERAVRVHRGDDDGVRMPHDVADRLRAVG